jgi:hypothetical protein
MVLFPEPDSPVNHNTAADAGRGSPDLRSRLMKVQ